MADGIEAACIGVFGSVDAGTDDAHSDIDVFVVGNISAVAAQAAFKAVGRKYRKTVNVVAVKPKELASRVTEGGAFWTSIAQGKRIDLKGSWVNVAFVLEAACAAAGASDATFDRLDAIRDIRNQKYTGVSRPRRDLDAVIEPTNLSRLAALPSLGNKNCTSQSPGVQERL